MGSGQSAVGGGQWGSLTGVALGIFCRPLILITSINVTNSTKNSTKKTAA